MRTFSRATHRGRSDRAEISSVLCMHCAVAWGSRMAIEACVMLLLVTSSTGSNRALGGHSPAKPLHTTGKVIVLCTDCVGRGYCRVSFDFLLHPTYGPAFVTASASAQLLSTRPSDHDIRIQVCVIGVLFRKMPCCSGQSARCRRQQYCAFLAEHCCSWRARQALRDILKQFSLGWGLDVVGLGGIGLSHLHAVATWQPVTPRRLAAVSTLCLLPGAAAACSSDACMCRVLT